MLREYDLKRSVVIWGLRSTRHSHRYIHAGWYTTLLEMGVKVYWVDDSPKNIKLLNSESTIFAVNIASEYLPIIPRAHYVLHNLAEEKFDGINRKVNLQVFTKNSTGAELGHPNILFDAQSRTLYQPWGISLPKNDWLNFGTKRSNAEYWIGSVWNNQLDQGNANIIGEFKSVLKERGIKFKKRGERDRYQLPACPNSRQGI